MQALLEFLPLLGIGVGYLIGKAIHPDMAMYYLSYGAIIGTVLQFAIFKAIGEKIQKMTLTTGWFLIIFASLTIILHNDLFVKLKPTVLSWLFALIFLGYSFFTKKSLLELMMGSQVFMPTENWLTLNWLWVVFNLFIGLVNLWVITTMDNDAWATFKLVFLPIFSLIFVAGQTLYIFKKGKLLANKASKDNDQREM